MQLFAANAPCSKIVITHTEYSKFIIKNYFLLLATVVENIL